MTADNASYITGVLVGVLIGILIIFLGLRYCSNGKKSNEYDERQQMIRGKGFKYAFFTQIILSGLILILETCETYIPVTATCQLFIAMTFSIMVYVAYTIWNDAYFSLTNNRKRFIIVFFVLSVINYLGGYRMIADGKALTDGKLNLNISNFVLAIMLTVVFVLIWIKSFIEKKEARE